ncbi:MAG: peptide chain release factor N(5)-glutamine methyltransferase [Planctomycetota bacterium]|nr:peptide chain release factor N(5)-glutamine methyltransferase [Planctomycetota bacterium]MEC8653366.1 peptide chain release factor N(5)-glutamine methyltransferase [Planctomycetota bacterium]MEC9047935.1 peptide chain release factor N(5)-glutamine methyltransferase [Planctomycetota bacterium]
MSEPRPAGDVQHTVMTVLRASEGWLEKRGVDAPKRSSELLLGSVLGVDRLQLYLDHDRPLDEQERAAMRALLVRRGEGEPVAHLIGSWGFRDLELEVGPAVLIPRPETEELVDVALQLLGEREGVDVLDLGTGSGAIAIAIASERPGAQVLAVDCSQNALAIARSNAAGNDVGERVAFAHGSWWDAVEPGRTFDLVVSNPPYIDPSSAEGLADDVKRFEPPLALFSAPGDPASCYREIAAGLAAHLKPGGWFIAETGLGAAEPSREVLATTAAMGSVELRGDASGKPRFLLAQRADS